MKTFDEIKLEMTEPVVISDQFGIITYINPPFEAIFGWKASEIIGQTLAVLIPALYHDAHNLGFARFAMTEQPTVLNHPLQLMAVTKAGQSILSEHYITAEHSDGQWLFGAVLRPLQST